ncbi:MAG: hypothetical protein LBO08_03075 [Rickettsiales bacterium]|jgi:hypothetical protein|nr:hypothetical protein [Rickettsiales bacterium]
MNIFLVILVFMFMAGYYFLDAPSQNKRGSDVESVLSQAALESMAECVAATHMNALRGQYLVEPCQQEYSVATGTLCFTDKDAVVDCETESKTKRPAYSYMITTSAPVADADIHKTLEIIEKSHPDSSNFGVFSNGFLLAGGGDRAEISEKLAKSAKLEPNQITYITQFYVPDESALKNGRETEGIVCAAGEIKLMRFGKWQCATYNQKITCTGDTIYETGSGTCVADPRRKPLCAGNQTAVQVDDLWTCANPQNEARCDAGFIARMDYETMTWECIADPLKQRSVKKCESTARVNIGIIGTTIRSVRNNSCTDCETEITNPDTCESFCVPDPDKLKDAKCYGKTAECSGPHRAFYFGFPNDTAYIGNAAASISSLKDIRIDAGHSQNRMFNCLDCGSGSADNSGSPFVAECK